MSSVGTFGSFTTARLGIYASQKALSVTGNNIANINTVGYTRQRLDQVSLNTGGSDRYRAKYDVRVGTGVLCVGVSQIRDPYLDIRYRSEMSSVGALDTKMSGLNDLASILDEVGKGENGGDGVLEAQFNDLVDALSKLSTYAGQNEYDGQVRASAQSLVTLFNLYAKKLDEVGQNTAVQLDQETDVVNEILTSIRDLNSSIRKSEIYGDSALELRDERNNLIDQLSQYMKIDVTYTTEEISVGQTVEKLVIKLGNANPDSTVTTDSSTLVDGVYATQLSLDATNNYEVTLDPLADSKGRVQAGSTPVVLDDNDLYGALQSLRELLTESGEFVTPLYISTVDENAATKRGIPYYQKSLDLLANQFAAAFNDANVDAGFPALGGVLFSNSGDSDNIANITAANISISYSWGKGDVKIANSFTETYPGSGIPSTQNDNILHMLALMDTKMTYNPNIVSPGAVSTNMFRGTFQEMLTNTCAVLANDARTTSTMLNTYYTAAVSLDASRDSVSGVDLNDEAANLMQYQKSYSAACRLMTTLDEVLDKLINGTGIVGR